MKPGEHPDFFRFPSPPGTSRESQIRLDYEGRFWQGDEPIDDPPMLVQALHRWIARHPDNGRFILTNGYDWTYFAVDDVAFVIRSVNECHGTLQLALSDGTHVAMPSNGLTEGATGALYVTIQVHESAFEARFSRHAQLQLTSWLVDVGGVIGIQVGDAVVVPSPRQRNVSP